MRIKSWMLLPLTILASAGLLSADVVLDSYNTTEPLATSVVWGPINDIGWYYSPTISYTLDQVDTTFNGDGPDRSITLEIWSNAGPTTSAPSLTSPLASETFNSSGAEGSFGGSALSSAVTITAGNIYFVGLEGIDGLGVNEVDFNDNGGAGPTGSVFVGNTYQDDSGAQFGSLGCDTDNWFCKPELEFLGPSTTSAVPEPANVSYLVFGLLAVGGWIQTRRNRSSKRQPE